MAFLQFDAASYPLNNNEWSFPLVEIIHIISFAVLISTIAIVDFRLLGLGLKRYSPAQLMKDLAPWTLGGLIVVLMSGPLIFFSMPIIYLYNGGFRFKMGALLLAILYNYTVHRKVILSNPSPATGKIVGLLSLALWISVVGGGIFIAFV